MEINQQLKDKIAKAVRTSMRIEGYPPSQSERVREQARQLMERQRVQVSLSRK